MEIATILKYLESPALIICVAIIWWQFRERKVERDVVAKERKESQERVASVLSEMGSRLADNTATMKELSTLDRLLIAKFMKESP